MDGLCLTSRYLNLHGYNVGSLLQLAKKEVRKFASKMVTSKEAWNEVNRLKENDERRKNTQNAKFHRTAPMDPLNTTAYVSLSFSLHAIHCRSCFHGVRHLIQQSNGLNGTLGQTTSFRRSPPDTATQTLRLQRETDFLKLVSFASLIIRMNYLVSVLLLPLQMCLLLCPSSF